MAAKQQQSSTQSNSYLVNTVVLFLLHISLSKLWVSALSFFFSFLLLLVERWTFFCQSFDQHSGVFVQFSKKCLILFSTAFVISFLSGQKYFSICFFEICWYEIMQKPCRNQLYRILCVPHLQLSVEKRAQTVTTTSGFSLSLYMPHLSTHTMACCPGSRKKNCRVDDSSIK